MTRKQGPLGRKGVAEHTKKRNGDHWNKKSVDELKYSRALEGEQAHMNMCNDLPEEIFSSSYIAEPRVQSSSLPWKA